MRLSLLFSALLTGVHALQRRLRTHDPAVLEQRNLSVVNDGMEDITPVLETIFSNFAETVVTGDDVEAVRILLETPTPTPLGDDDDSGGSNKTLLVVNEAEAPNNKCNNTGGLPCWAWTVIAAIAGVGVGVAGKTYELSCNIPEQEGGEDVEERSEKDDDSLLDVLIDYNHSKICNFRSHESDEDFPNTPKIHRTLDKLKFMDGLYPPEKHKAFADDKKKEKAYEIRRFILILEKELEKAGYALPEETRATIMVKMGQIRD